MHDPFRLDFVGIGAARCGTTWLADCLRAHPQICVSRMKELRYFNARHHLWNVPNENHAKPFSWYVGQFEHCSPAQVKGEFSPAYLSDEAAPVLLKERFPDAKLLVCLRNPIDRAYSGYLMRVFHGVEQRSFEQAVAQRSDSITNGFYAQHLARYFELFERKQILVLFFDEITADPSGGLRHVFAFLGVDPDLPLPDAILTTRVNPAKPPRENKLLNRTSLVGRIARHPSLWPVRVLYRKIASPKRDAELSDSPWQYPPMKAKTREALFDIYKDDISRLEQMLSRDLSHWR